MRIGVCLVALCTMACVRVNLGSGSPPPTVYLLQPSLPAPAVALHPVAVAINDFGASPLYDTHDMILVAANGTVVRAGRNLWASRPADACADILWRDLVVSKAVQAAYRRGRTGREIVVEGHLSECGARQIGEEWYAVLDVTLSIVKPGTKTDGLQRHLRMERPLEGKEFAALAVTMSSLARVWSDAAMAAILQATSPAPGPDSGSG
ncbi:membrane integrity-associated transporter subunit PqiC [Candidatus Fermentibacteria bacterium]|nr:membrane integrity-associated transporter subunit PqiC [Candidatus Fermentibacteria bacterium]